MSKHRSHKKSHGLNLRRETALEYWEDRLTLDDGQLKRKVKRFKDERSVTEKEFKSYRDFVGKQIETLKGRIRKD